MRLGRLLSVARKELLQLRRDRLTLAMMVVLPVLQLLLFGYAINTDVRHAPTVVLDDDRSARSRAFVRSMEATGYFDRVGDARDHDELSRALRGGVARVGVVIPARQCSSVDLPDPDGPMRATLSPARSRRLASGGRGCARPPPP